MRRPLAPYLLQPSSGAVTGFDELSPADLGQEKAGVPPVDMSSWLVLYCGSNASVERVGTTARTFRFFVCFTFE